MRLAGTASLCGALALSAAIAGCSGPTATGAKHNPTLTTSHVASSTTTSTQTSTPSASAVATSTTTTIPSTTTAPPNSHPALVAILQTYFKTGCNGGCTQLSEPATAFTVTPDHNHPDWSRWSVDDPSVGSGYGYAELVNGAWEIVAGPGSAQVGCSPSTDLVPAQVLSDFGASCPADS